MNKKTFWAIIQEPYGMINMALTEADALRIVSIYPNIKEISIEERTYDEHNAPIFAKLRYCRDCGDMGTEYIHNLDGKEVWLCDDCYDGWVNVGLEDSE